MTRSTSIGPLLLLSSLSLVLLHCSSGLQPPGRGQGAVREIRVTVKSEYSPGRISVKKGQPVRLLFYREDDSDCTAQVVFEDFQIKKDLAANQETAVELTPAKEGRYTFACGMGMIKGTLEVEK